MLHELQQLSNDQLITQLMLARDEVADLRAQLAQRASLDPNTPSVAGEPVFTVSMNVLQINGSNEQRVCRSVPLEAIMARASGRLDDREADTPVCNQGEAHPRFSVEMGRFSGFSVASDAESETLVASPQRDSLQSMASSNASPQSTMKAGRPAPLNIKVAGIAPPLNADSIMSQQTLHTFAQRHGQDPLSPQSSVATSVMQYMMDVFARKQDFSHDTGDKAHMESFGRTLLRLCGEVERCLHKTARHPTIASPVYTFGDIHGNFKDLHYFATQLINFDDLHFIPYNLLFLGDYVDRGPFGVEVIAYLFALKVLAPEKVTLLRGNHEDTLVNGDTSLYNTTSFKAQCIHNFGQLLGSDIWTRCNRVFANLPLTANIDGKIFCTHGGLPRYTGGIDNRMEQLVNPDFTRFETFFSVPENESKHDAACRQMATDVCWSDPAEDEGSMDRHGFGPNPRGNGVIMFGGAAVDSFLEKNKFEYIFRAHQEKSDGLKISKNARVITIFSTSAYVGHENGAGVVYVADGRIRLIVKEPDEIPVPH
jgi:protein phosphatase